MSIPVFFIHEGNQEYLKIAIDSARKHNKDVYLLGDKSNRNFSSKFIYIESLDMTKYEEFEKVYKHMSTNNYEFEINCFKRYFVLIEAMKMLEIDKCIMLDSDVITFYNYSDINYDLCKAAISIPKEQNNYRFTASPHCSYWTTYGIEKFVEFCINTYKSNISVLKDKYTYHKLNNKKGGICDMTLLYLWAKEEKSIFNNLNNHNGIVIDLNISSNENYTKFQYNYNNFLKIKKVYRINNSYYLKKDKKYDKIVCLHFQGRAKFLMKNIYYNEGKVRLIIDRYLTFIKYILNKSIGI